MSLSPSSGAADNRPNDYFARYFWQMLPILQQSRKAISTFAIVAFAFALIHLHLSKPYYDATATLGPGGSSPQSATQTSLSTLSALTGITGPATKLSPYDQFQQVLASNDLVAHLDNDEDVLDLLYPGVRDMASHTWKPRGGLLFGVKRLTYEWLNWPLPTHPDIFELRRALSKRLIVARDNKTNIVTVTLRGRTPDQARRILSKIIYESDQLVRAQFREMAFKYSSFIEQKLATITSVDQRTSLDNLLTEYDRMEILAEVGLPFTSSMIDPPSAPLTPTGPNPLLIVAGWVFAGLVLGIAFALRPKRLKHLGIASVWRKWRKMMRPHDPAEMRDSFTF